MESMFMWSSVLIAAYQGKRAGQLCSALLRQHMDTQFTSVSHLNNQDPENWNEFRDGEGVDNCITWEMIKGSGTIY